MSEQNTERKIKILELYKATSDEGIKLYYLVDRERRMLVNVDWDLFEDEEKILIKKFEQEGLDESNSAMWNAVILEGKTSFANKLKAFMEQNRATYERIAVYYPNATCRYTIVRAEGEIIGPEAENAWGSGALVRHFHESGRNPFDGDMFLSTKDLNTAAVEFQQWKSRCVTVRTKNVIKYDLILFHCVVHDTDGFVVDSESYILEQYARPIGSAEKE